MYIHTAKHSSKPNSGPLTRDNFGLWISYTCTTYLSKQRRSITSLVCSYFHEVGMSSMLDRQRNRGWVVADERLGLGLKKYLKQNSARELFSKHVVYIQPSVCYFFLVEYGVYTQWLPWLLTAIYHTGIDESHPVCMYMYTHLVLDARCLDY